jgi:hypothetical protein
MATAPGPQPKTATTSVKPVVKTATQIANEARWEAENAERQRRSKLTPSQRALEDKQKEKKEADQKAAVEAAIKAEKEKIGVYFVNGQIVFKDNNARDSFLAAKKQWEDQGKADEEAKSKTNAALYGLTDQLARGAINAQQNSIAGISGGGTPTIAKSLAPGQSVGGTKTMVTNDTGSYFVESTKGTPKISVATATGGTRTSDNATNITPIVNYTSATQTPIINNQLVDQAKKVQGLMSSALVNSVYSGQATQTTRPEVTITPITDYTPNGPSQILGTALQINTPLSPLSTNISTVPLEREQARYDRNLEQEKKDKAADLARLESEAKKAQDLKDAANKIKFDEQAKKTADLEAKRLADAKAAEEARFRSQQQFDYDSQIEAALRAAEGNSSLARRQFSAYEERQQTMDAEKLAQQRAKRGNPAGYAGGFAQKAIQPTPATPAAIKAPAMKAPQTPVPIEPPANKLTSSFLPPKVDGLQFGGT